MRKRFRYFPQVPYRHNHFELLYVHAGHCRYVSPIQAQNLEHGDFCLVEYGVPHQILNHSDACILIELSIHREKLETLCASLLEEEHILTRYFKGSALGVASLPWSFSRLVAPRRCNTICSPCCANTRPASPTIP